MSELDAYSTTTWTALFYRYYLGQGVIPVIDKRPRIKQWQRGGLKSPDSILKVMGRFDRKGGADLGVPTGFPLEDGGNLLVLDVDKRSGAHDALATLPPLPETAMVKTKDGNHYWFRTEKPFTSTVRPDGLELKGAGSYVAVPPSTDKKWLQHPHDVGIAPAPDWLISRPPPEKRVSSQYDRLTAETSLVYGPMLSFVRGTRTWSLIQRAAAWSARGWVSDQHAAMLVGAAIQVGLAQKEATRIVTHYFRPDRPKTRPGHALPALAMKGEGRSRECNTGIVSLSEMDTRVLKTALEEIKTQHSGRGKWEHLGDAWAQVLSCRHVAARSECSFKTASRSLQRLVLGGFLWLSPELYQLKKGQRAAYQYRPTFYGVSYAEELLGVNPWRSGQP